MKLCGTLEQRNITSIRALRCSYILNIFFIFLVKYGIRIHCFLFKIVARVHLRGIHIHSVMFHLFNTTCVNFLFD